MDQLVEIHRPEEQAKPIPPKPDDIDAERFQCLIDKVMLKGVQGHDVEADTLPEASRCVPRHRE